MMRNGLVSLLLMVMMMMTLMMDLLQVMILSNPVHLEQQQRQNQYPMGDLSNQLTIRLKRLELQDHNKECQEANKEMPKLY